KSALNEADLRPSKPFSAAISAESIRARTSLCNAASTAMAALNGLLGRKSAWNEAAKTVAQDILQRQKIKDIRPHVRAQDDARLGRMANEAFRRGETVEAAHHKRL
ncbi:hypothetical protein ACT4UT_29320, partial [Bacillus sp. B-TM1]